MKHKTVTDYLDSLTWDGTPRIDRWLVGYAGAEDTPHVRAVSRTMLVAAVRRARHPGCRFDQMPIIHGPQGCGKSSALRLLAIDDAWFCDVVTIDDERQIIEATAGKWIVETTELSSALKAFLSRPVDVARMTYQRDATRVPRGFVMVGTTHAGDYLPDATANRRFWPVTVWRFDLGRLIEIRDQLWAEAAAAEAAGASLEIDPDAALSRRAARGGDAP
jgi:predicted P-loop ATPase